MRSILFLMLLAPLARAGEDPELRFLEAWYALGDPGKATAAEETFRALHDAETTPDELKARCLLGLAECARLQGDEAKQRALLEEVLASHKGTQAAERARRILGDVRYLDRIVVVPNGRYLDLDDGTLAGTRRPVPGKEAEMRGAELLVEAAEDPFFGAQVSPGSAKPWKGVRTSEGRSAWVQVLDPGPPTVLRLVTRLSGTGEVLRAPRDPFCLGGPKGIEIHFEPSRQYARYRIERSADGEDVKEIGVVKEPPFLDETAEEGVRYLYRITGEDEGGVRGLPATLEGTRESRGVVTGVVGLDRGQARQFDFLLGKVVDDGDITMTGAYGSWDGASFLDGFGREIRAIAPSVGESMVSWDYEIQGSTQIPAGSTFVVPLRGGGIARCRLEMPPEDVRRTQRIEAVLHYEACGDGPVFPEPAKLTAKRSENGATVTIHVLPPYRVGEIEVTDLATGESLPAIQVTDGVATDTSAREGDIREYRAVPVSADGRRGAVATATLALFPDGPRAGEFQFHYQQGYSIETARIVDAGQADVFFQNCAGGIHSITLSAPGGIVNMERLLPPDLPATSPGSLLDVIVGADPGVQLNREAEGDSRRPASDVFLLRTRNGGWAKLAITERGTARGWTEYPATVKYVFNAKEPVFSQEEGEEVGGVRIHGLARLQDRARILKDWQDGWLEITEDPVRRLAVGGDPQKEGVMLDAAVSQEVLFSRQRYQDYEKSTFSFAVGVRDDPTRELTRNDWSLEYGNGGDTFWVRTVGDDRSTITDLGAVDWKELAQRKDIQEREAERAEARYGHMYLVHVLDTDENYFALMRVTALTPGDQVAFEWVALRDGKVTLSPGLVLPKSIDLWVLLMTLPKTPEARWEGKELARSTHKRLTTPELRIGIVDADAAKLLEDIRKVTGVKCDLAVKEVAHVSIFGARLTPEVILDSICEQTRLHWRIAEDGTVRIGKD